MTIGDGIAVAGGAIAVALVVAALIAGIVYNNYIIVKFESEIMAKHKDGPAQG